MPGCLYVIAMHVSHFFSECCYKPVAHVFVYKDIVRSDACLAAVQCLSPRNPACRCPEVCIPSYYAGTLAAQLEHYRCEILCGRFHDGPCKGRTAGEEYKVEAVFKQGRIYFSVALNYSYIVFLECVTNHIPDNGGYVRDIGRWFEHCSAAWRNGSYERIKKQLDRIIPWWDYKGIAQRLFYDIAAS